jgi:4-amino-4-deoxy-L-arabinose transferase-like glycosyltransferase
MNKNSQKTLGNKTKEKIFLLLIFVVSLLIRQIGLDTGFPLLTHPDESTIIDPVVMMTETKNLNPGNFNRPDQILFFLNYFYLNALSYLRFGDNLAVTFQENQLFFYHYARFLISIMGALIPVIAYLIGKQFNRKLAIISALVFAFFPAYIVHSAYITPDVPITLFTLLVIYFTLRYLKKDDTKGIYLATLFAAINTAEKYPGLISLSIVFLGILLKRLDEDKMRKIKWGLLVKDPLKFSLIFLLSLAIVAPNLIIERKLVLDALITEARTTHLGADNLDWGGNLIFYIQQFGFWSNFLAVLFIVIGFFALIRWRDPHTLLLLFGLLYWVILSRLPLHWERWALPMYTAPLFLIAEGIFFLWKKTKTKKFARIATVIITYGFFIHQITAALYFPVRMSFTDTRVVAQEYCKENNITQENSIFEGYTPLLPTYPKTIFDEDLEQEGIEYVILSSLMYDRYYAEPYRYTKEIDFYEQIKKDKALVKIFESEPIYERIFKRLDTITYGIEKQLFNEDSKRNVGPKIEIYRTK